MMAQTNLLASKYLAGYRGLSTASWAGISLCFFESILASVFYYLSYYFVYVLHIPIATAGLMIACYGIGAIAGGIVSGKLADRFGAAKIASASMLIQGMGYLNLLFLTNPHWLMINLFVVGLATYGFLTTNYLCVLAQCSTEHQRLQAISLMAAAANLGLGLAGFLIGAFAAYGFHIIFAISGTLLVIMACYQGMKKTTLATYSNTSLPSTSNREEGQYGLLLIALFCVLAIGSIVAQTSTTYAVYLQTKFPAMGVRAASLLFALNSFLVVFFQTPITHACRHFNKLKLVGVGSFLIGIGMCSLTIASNYPLAMLSCAIYTLGEILFFSSVQLICYQAGAVKKKGQSLGLYRTTYATSRVLGPALGGIAYANYGGNVIWYVSGVLGVACLGLCLKFKNTN